MLDAGEAEAAEAGSSDWYRRSSGCLNAEGRVAQASNRVSSLIYGNGFLPAGLASQAMDRVRDRLAEAQERARAACAPVRH